MRNEPLEDPVFLDEVQDFARRYYNQKKDLLFMKSDDILSVNYVPQQRALPMYDRHATTLPTRDPISSTERIRTSRRGKSVSKNTRATHLAGHQKRCCKSHQTMLDVSAS